MNKPELAKFDIKELQVTCLECLNFETVLVRPEDWQAWMHGKHVQDAFPYLTEGQREILISATCGPCFDKMFPEEDES